MTSETIMIESGAVHIVGAVPADGGKPAAIQPLANAEGALGHSTGTLFSVSGADAHLALKGLVLNAMAAGEEGNLNLLNATSTHQKVIIDDCVVSHTQNVAIWAVGTSTDFHITNSIFKSSTGYPGGMFFGGVLWGAGFWMGTIDTLVFQYNTVEGQIGEAFALYEHVDYGIIDHNTFANIIMDVVWYRGQNNVQVTNNLFYNTKSYGQSSNDVTGWGVWWAGGVGQIFGQWAKSLGCITIGTVGSDEKINIAKENGYDHVINYNKEDFAKKVLEITDGKGVPVVYDGVGKDTLEGSIECLAIRGMMVSFGNASGPLSDINVPKMLQPKG